MIRDSEETKIENCRKEKRINVGRRQKGKNRRRRKERAR